MNEMGRTKNSVLEFGSLGVEMFFEIVEKGFLQVFLIHIGVPYRQRNQEVEPKAEVFYVI